MKKRIKARVKENSKSITPIKKAKNNTISASEAKHTIMVENNSIYSFSPEELEKAINFAMNKIDERIRRNVGYGSTRAYMNFDSLIKKYPKDLNRGESNSYCTILENTILERVRMLGYHAKWDYDHSGHYLMIDWEDEKKKEVSISSFLDKIKKFW